MSVQAAISMRNLVKDGPLPDLEKSKSNQSDGQTGTFCGRVYRFFVGGHPVGTAYRVHALVFVVIGGITFVVLPGSAVLIPYWKWAIVTTLSTGAVGSVGAAYLIRKIVDLKKFAKLNKELEENIDELEDNIDELDEEVDQLDGINDKLNNEVKQLGGINNNLNIKVEELKVIVDKQEDLQEDFKELNEDYTELNVAHTNVVSELESTTKQLRLAQKSFDDMLRELQLTNQELTNTKNKIAQAFNIFSTQTNENNNNYAKNNETFQNSNKELQINIKSLNTIGNSLENTQKELMANLEVTNFIKLATEFYKSYSLNVNSISGNNDQNNMLKELKFLVILGQKIRVHVMDNK